MARGGTYCWNCGDLVAVKGLCRDCHRLQWQTRVWDALAAVAVAGLLKLLGLA